MTNASVNFLIYWSMSACFKSVLQSSLKKAVKNLARCGEAAGARGCGAGGLKHGDVAVEGAVGGGEGAVGLLVLPALLSTSVSTRLNSFNSSQQLQPNIVVTECSD